MKILLINKDFSKECGGTGRYIWNLGQLLQKNGHEVFYFANSRKPYFIENYKYSKYFPKYIDYRNLSVFEKVRYFFKPFYDFSAEKLLLDYIQEIKPDVIHLNCYHINLSISVLRACIKSKVPFVVTVHEASLICPSGVLLKGGCNYCRELFCLKGKIFECLRNRCSSGSLLKSVICLLVYLFDNSLNLYEKVPLFITPSIALKKLVAKKIKNKKRIVHINNFIADDLLQNAAKKENEGYLLYVGRLVREKGVQNLLYAIKHLPHLSLKIVGNGPYEEELKNIVKELRLKNVEFCCYKSGKALEDIYKRSLAVILPSICFEVFGLTVIEAFSHKKPVIGSDLGGISEIIDDGVNGFIFESINIQQLKNLIELIAINPNKAVLMGEKARSKAENIYNSQNHYFKIINAYNSVIDQSNVSPTLKVESITQLHT